MPAPFFPFGIYDKDEMIAGTPAWQAHYAALMALLAVRNINTVVIQSESAATTDPTNRLFVMDRADAHGLMTIMTIGNPQNPSWDQVGNSSTPFFPAYTHPSVLAYKYGDEPKTGTTKTLGVVAATSTNPIVITTSGEHLWGTSIRVAFAAMPADFAALNGNAYSITNVANDRFSVPIDGSAFAAYTSGGSATHTSDADRMIAPYAAIRSVHAAPAIVTAVIGDIATLGPLSGSIDEAGYEDGVESHLWTEFESEVRWARYYPMRRTYSLVPLQEPAKYHHEFHTWCRLMESWGATPWWHILQSFGRGTSLDVSSFWRFPTSAELSSMTHLALANGARGIIGFCLQDFGSELGLVDETLLPRAARDGSIPLDEIAALGALTRTHAGLLNSHARAQFAVVCSSEDMEVVPRSDPLTGLGYVYAVNRNAETTVTGAISARRALQIRLAVDEYTRVPLLPWSFSADQFSALADSTFVTADGGSAGTLSADLTVITTDSASRTADGGYCDVFDLVLTPGDACFLRLTDDASMWFGDVTAVTADTSLWKADGVRG